MNEPTAIRVPEQGSSRYRLGFSLLALAPVWVGFVWWASQRAADADLWQVGTLIVLAAMPCALTLAYLSSIRRIDFLHKVETGSWLRPVLSGYFTRLVLSLIVAVLTGVGLVLSVFSEFGKELAIVLLAEAALLIGLVRFVDRRIGAAAVPWYRHSLSVRPAVLLAAAAATALYLLLAYYGPAPVRYGSLLEAVEAQARYKGSSELVDAVASVAAFVNGAQDWIIGLLRSDFDKPWLAAAAMSLSYFTFFFGFACSLAGFMLPRTELRRILLSDASPLPAAPTNTRLVAAGLILVALCGVMAWTLEAADGWVQEFRGADRTRHVMRVVAVNIDGAVYQVSPAARDEVFRLASGFGVILSERRVKARQALEAVFDRQEKNVGAYLDWHYSLKGEALRGAAILTSWGANKVVAVATERLSVGITNEFSIEGAKVEAVRDAADKLTPILSEMLKRQAHPVTDGQTVIVVEHTSLASMLQKAGIPATGRTRQRFAASVGMGAGGGLTAFLVTRSLRNVAGRQLTAAGRRAVLTGAARRVATRAGTSAAGGSVVPGAGTAVGLVAGAGIAVATEYVLLKNDEKENRPLLERQLLHDIKRAKIQTLAEFDRAYGV